MKSYIRQLFFLGCITIALVIIGDILSRIAKFLEHDFTRYTYIVKIILLLLYGGFYIVNIKRYLNNKTTKFITILILGLIGLFLVSNFSFGNNPTFNIENSTFLVRYLFFPITLLVFYELFLDEKAVKKLFKYYEWFFIANLILMIIALVFNMELFKSYPNPNRFGFSGIMNRTNQISYITILFIAIYYYKSQFLKLKVPIKLIFIILAALLIGTKRIYFFIIILFIYHLYNIRASISKIHIGISALLLFLSFIFKTQIIALFKSTFGIFIKIYHEKGFLAALFSYRNQTLSDTLSNEVFPKWDFLNIFIGGTSFTEYRPELDLIDLFLFFGLIGLVIYFLLIKELMKSLNNRNTYMKLFLGLCLIIAFSSSGFFISVNIPFVFLLGLFYLNSICLVKTKTN